MNEEKDTLDAQFIDQVIEGDSLLPHDRQTTRLIQHLQTSSQEYALANERSLDHIWSRLVQHQDHPFSLSAQWKPSEEKLIILKEKKAMQDTPTSGEMNSLPSLLQPKKRRSLKRIVGLSLIAAVVLITIVSFTLFSGLLRSTTQTASKGSKTITGATPQQQFAISHGTFVCSFSDGPAIAIANSLWRPEIAWSSLGEIAVTNYASVKAYSAQNCSSATLSQSSIQRTRKALWSPDGKKLLVGDVGDNSAYVLNSQGNIITHLSDINIDGSAWSSDSTKIILTFLNSIYTLSSIKSVDLSNGNEINMLAFPDYTDVTLLSPDGKLALVFQGMKGSKSVSFSIWDVKSGKKITDFPSTLDLRIAPAIAFSPDGSQLAVSVPGAIQIYTTANGHLLTSITDTSSPNEEYTLAWSPNGRYLAESTNAVKIYDVNTKKLVTTFGTVDAQLQIINLAWAPDNTGIAFTTMVSADGVPSDNMVNVWKLS